MLSIPFPIHFSLNRYHFKAQVIGMSQAPSLFSTTSLSGFLAAVYQQLYTTMTRVLNTIFENIADRLYVKHVPLVTRKTQCLLTYMYLYFFNPQSQKPYTHLSDYYLKKHLCDIAYVNADFPRYEYQQQMTRRFRHYALRLEILFRSLLPDMLLSLCHLESHSPKNHYAYSRFRLRELLFTFQ